MVFVRGGGCSDTAGDNRRTEFNRILCTSKSEATVTSNKKTVLKLTTDKHEARAASLRQLSFLLSNTPERDARQQNRVFLTTHLYTAPTGESCIHIHCTTGAPA